MRNLKASDMLAKGLALGISLLFAKLSKEAIAPK